MEDFARAVELIGQGEVMAASSILQAVGQDQEKIPLDVLITCGWGFYAQGCPDHAATWLELAVRQAAAGSNTEKINTALGWLGLAYLEQGQMDKAAAVQEISKHEDLNETISLGLFQARWLAVHGDQRGACTVYRKQLCSKQLSTFDTVLVLLERGRCHYTGSAFAAAAEDWQRAAKLASLLGDRLLLAWCRKVFRPGIVKDVAAVARQKKQDAPALYFTLFGDFSILRGEEQLAVDNFSRRKALALLQYLALQPRYRAARDKILELFWGEEADSNTLHVTVHALRKALSTGLAHRPSYVILHKGMIALNEELVAGSDAQQFRSCIQAARTYWDSDRAKAVECYRQARNLYRGELLANVPEYCWMINQKENYLQMYLEALTRMAEAETARGGKDGVLSIWLEVLELEPGHEQAVRQIMSLLARNGRINKSLDYYKRYALYMERELGLKPAPGVKKLYDDLKNAAEDEWYEAKANPKS